MNKLEKFFNTLHSTNSRVLKKFTTSELISQIKEYIDFTPYICKNIYRLLISQNSEDRHNGSQILESIMFQFKLVTDFKIEYLNTKEEYLCSTGEEFVAQKISVSEQNRMFKKLANLEHVDSKIVSEIDFKLNDTFTIKKQKVKDKPIENAHDFFENITNNLLNYEWNKRHGAFLAFIAMFSKNWNGDIEIKVDSSLFAKIYEILKNDKFNDFIDDKTVAPVRESAACLLSCIYPRIPPNTIISELFKFLEDDDWQTQYSGLLALRYLKNFIQEKKLLCSKLENLLVGTDEDVKYLSAELLCHFLDFCDIDTVVKRCWENIRDEEEIAFSKSSIILLISKLQSKFKKEVYLEKNLKHLFLCFTSPVTEVKLSVLKIVENINDESINFLVAEMILLEDKEEVRELAISVLKKKKCFSENFIRHFVKILSVSLYEPYVSDDFVSHDELFFTKSGIKLIGKDIVLKNKIQLFDCLYKNVVFEVVVNETIIGKTFLEIVKKFVNPLKDTGKSSGSKKSKKENNRSSSYKIFENNYDEKMLREFYSSCKEMKLVHLNEIKNKLVTPGNPSIHPLGDPIFADYVRLLTFIDIPIFTCNIINLYKYETCNQFLEFLSSLVAESEDFLLDDFLYNSYINLLLGFDGFLVFFKEYGKKLFDHHFFEYINNDKDKMKFFSKTISFYSSNLDQIEFLFSEALELKQIEVLKGYLVSFKYGEIFIDHILRSGDLSLLYPLISAVDHSFYPLFVKPLLKIISSNDAQKDKAFQAFSYIIPRLNFRINKNISEKWIKEIEECRSSLECMLDIKKIKDYEIKCPTTIKLRKYQIEGVKWISFLNSYNLNGILADDMGLGKTIQVLSYVCSEMYKTDRKILIVCPSSLTGHWLSEIEKFFPSVKPVLFKKKKMIEYDALIVSYDMFRNEHTYFVNKEWFYIILDEGHILRNSQTLLYSRICQFKSSNKLILTGTPVHNSIDDLISLFNIIMPNYLENEKDINYLSSKMSDLEVEKMHARLENLNKKILPFVLRRLKVDVLTDLPPKIIRDITVEMGPEQQKIYNSIVERDNVNENEINYKAVQSKADGLKRTKDLLNISSHILYFKKTSEISCKVKALEDIINLCGGEEIRNKILIFFQYRTTIDYVIEDIKARFKLKYLRLDGSVPASKRSKIASDFNTGNIPILFLTTQIGGLGLNLTGADTVIFYEHDWNPFNDLQAMDRAHRIGQKRTVNVFRLIAKNTIEEKVMDLQSFKLFIASSLVSQQNADIETMDTKDLLERFKK